MITCYTGVINVEGTLLKTHFNLMLISLKCDQVTILDRNTCETYNVSYLIIQRYFRQYILNLFICARYFFSLFFSCANFFLVFAQPSPQKFNGPSLRRSNCPPLGQLKRCRLWSGLIYFDAEITTAAFIFGNALMVVQNIV